MYEMKIYAIFHNLSGRRFSFEARDEIDANLKAEKWCDKHGLSIGGHFEIQEVEDNFDLHNEFVA
jgi:hypothetical protein